MLPRKSSPNWKKWFSLYLPATAFALALIVFFFGVFRVEKVVCLSDPGPCSQDLQQAVEKLSLGQNIFLFSVDRFESGLRQVLPEIREVKAEKKIPNQIVFTLKFFHPVVAAVWEEKSFLISENGLVLAQAEGSTGLPVYHPGRDLALTPGDWLSAVDLLAVKVLYESRLRSFDPISASLLEEGGIEVKYRFGPLVIFSSEKMITDQLDSLQFILEQLKIENGKIERIDLRFEKPVIVNQKS